MKRQDEGSLFLLNSEYDFTNIYIHGKFIHIGEIVITVCHNLYEDIPFQVPNKKIEGLLAQLILQLRSIS